MWRNQAEKLLFFGKKREKWELGDREVVVLVLGGQTAYWHFHFEPERRLMTQGRLLGASEGAAGGPQRSGELLRRRGHFNWTLNDDMTTLQREQRGGAFSSKRPITGFILLLMLCSENKHVASHGGHMSPGWSERMFRHKQRSEQDVRITKSESGLRSKCSHNRETPHQRLESCESCFTVTSGDTVANSFLRHAPIPTRCS